MSDKHYYFDDDKCDNAIIARNLNNTAMIVAHVQHLTWDSTIEKYLNWEALLDKCSTLHISFTATGKNTGFKVNISNGKYDFNTVKWTTIFETHLIDDNTYSYDITVNLKSGSTQIKVNGSDAVDDRFIVEGALVGIMPVIYDVTAKCTITNVTMYIE